MKKLAPSLLAALLFFACTGENAQLIAEQVAARVQKYRAEQTAEHQQKLLELASKNVDSLLLNEARQRLLDSLHQSRPFRPVADPPISPLDSGKARPLF